MEYGACDSTETPSQDSAMSEDVDLSDPAWRMSHPHLVRAMEARVMLSDKENETQTGSEDEDYIDMPPMSAIRRCRDPRTRRRLWSDDTGPCVSPTDTPPIPTTLDAMEEASEDSQPEDTAPTEAIDVPDTPDDVEVRDEEDEDDEPATMTSEPSRKEESSRECKKRLLEGMLNKAYEIRTAVKMDAATPVHQKDRADVMYREMGGIVGAWIASAYTTKDERPEALPSAPQRLLTLARDLCGIVGPEYSTLPDTKKTVQDGYTDMMRLAIMFEREADEVKSMRR